MQQQRGFSVGLSVPASTSRLPPLPNKQLHRIIIETLPPIKCARQEPSPLTEDEEAQQQQQQSIKEVEFPCQLIKTSLLHAALDNPYCIYPILYNWRRLSPSFPPCSSCVKASNGEEEDVFEHVMNEMRPYAQAETFLRLDCILARALPHHLIWIMFVFMEIDACFYEYVCKSYPIEDEFHMLFAWIYKRMICILKSPYFEQSAGEFFVLFWEDIRDVVLYRKMDKVQRECSAEVEKISFPRCSAKRKANRRAHEAQEKLDRIYRAQFDQVTESMAEVNIFESKPTGATETDNPAEFVMKRHEEYMEHRRQEELEQRELAEVLRRELLEMNAEEYEDEEEEAADGISDDNQSGSPPSSSTATSDNDEA